MIINENLLPLAPETSILGPPMQDTYCLTHLVGFLSVHIDVRRMKKDLVAWTVKDKRNPMHTRRASQLKLLNI